MRRFGWAAINGHPEVGALLLESGAGVDLCDDDNDDGETALH